MNIKTSEIKQSILREIGSKLDTSKEECEKRVEQARGGKIALRQMAKELQAHHALADRELEERKIPDLATLKLVKLATTRAIDALASKAAHLEVIEIGARGKLEQAGESVKLVEKMYLEENKKLETILEQIKAGLLIQAPDGSILPVEQPTPNGSGERKGAVVPFARPTGVRPGASIAQQRKAEEASQASSQPPSEDKGKATKARKKPATSKKKAAPRKLKATADAKNP